MTTVDARGADRYWPFPDETGLPSWDERSLALLPPSVDPTLLAVDLRLTPTERLLKLEALAASVEQIRAGRK